MSFSRTLRWTTLVLAGLFSLPRVAPAGEGWETYGVPARSLPWQQPGFQGYHETSKPARPAPATVNETPQKYTITITPLPQKVQGKDPNIVVLMAHLPEDAAIWFNDRPTTSKGMVRYFESPSLTPDKRYVYTVRLVWHEGGKWVGKTTKVPVRAGEMHCLYLTPMDQSAKIAANLEKLSAEDRKLAAAQKVCAIQQSNPLGAMGVPVKITLKGQPVFLCCKGCVETAQADPDKTLAKVKELKEKATRPSQPRKIQ
jgi:uncharacterized protein (TIGR03000 family)